MESEKSTERKLNAYVKRKGGLCIKLLPFQFKGLPDRLILFPSGKILFVEVKSEGKKPTIIQERVHKQIRDLGFEVLIIDKEEQIYGEI